MSTSEEHRILDKAASADLDSESIEPPLDMNSAEYSGAALDASGDDLSVESDVPAATETVEPIDTTTELSLNVDGDDLSVESGEPLLADTMEPVDTGTGTESALDTAAPLEPTNLDTGTPPTDTVGDVQTTQDVSEWVGDVNPLSTFGVAENCGSCALAVDSRIDGSSPNAEAGDSTFSVAEMEAATGRPQTAATPEEIEAGLKAAGPGSKSVIGIDRVDGPGHWFNAYYDGSRVVYIDGQTGDIGDWPPTNLGNVSAWDWNGPS